MKIISTTKLNDLLQEYPQLEADINKVVPEIQRLKQEVLLNNVKKIMNMERIALIKEMEVNDLLNILRAKVGQPAIGEDKDGFEIEYNNADPEWLKIQPELVVDGIEMLSGGEHPLEFVNQKMKELNPGQVLLLKTNFKPLPLIENMESQKYKTFSRTDLKQAELYLTFIAK